MGSELQRMNGQNKLALWAERVSACRSSDQSVRDWCKANGICEQTFYRWQRKLYGLAKAQQNGPYFAEVTPVCRDAGSIAITVRIDGVEADVHKGADRGTVEMVLDLLKSC